MKSENLVSVDILLALIAVFIVSFVLIGVSTACNCPDFFGDTGLEIGTANPAAVYCEELGYEYNVTTDNESGQRGICVFPDNSSCDAWDFFTAKCGANYSWCTVNGCGIKTVSDGRNQYSPEYAVCVLPDRTTEPVTEMMRLNEKVSVGAIETGYSATNITTMTRENGYTAAVNPPSFNWRNKDGQDWITPVRDQASCGSCWAFAAVGGVESKINIARNDSDFDPNLAEQYLVSDCCDYCGDCGGGSSTSALGFIKTQGISDEPCFPYTASDCPCSYRYSAWDKRLWKIDDYGYVPSGRENMKSYLIEKGPLVVSVCMNGYFDSNGIYRCVGSPGVNHAVVIVGYDDVEGCWIAKNSWGSGWNEDGYFKIGYGECGIEGYPRYIDLTKEQTEDFKADDIQVYSGTKTGELNDTYYKDGDYVTLAEKCYTISCDGLDATINLSVETLQNITSIDLIAYHRARWESGFSLYYWNENSDQWVSLGGIPDSTWHLMKYKICDSESECASYLSSGNVSVKYYHPSCSFCNTDYVDIDWLYLEAYPGKTYCPASTNNADYEWINRVALNTGERISGSSTYSDFTDEVLTTLNIGDTYTLQVDGHTTGSYLEFVKAWIDFNNDKDFIDVGEEIDLGNYTFNGNHTFSANFKVPEDAVLSDTRMRVYLKYQNEPQACENDSYGEVEDYKIRINSVALFTDNYSDYGIDMDEPPNGYYDYLAIDVGVNITKSGYFEIYGSLYDELGSYVGSAYNYSYLNNGNQSVILKFDGINIRQNGVNGTYTLKYLRLFDDKYDELDYRYDAYTTPPYNYTDFEPVPAMFTPRFNDYGEDTNSNALYDYLVIEKEINILKAGDYGVSGWLYAPNGASVEYDSNYTTLSAGLHNVTLKFGGWDIYRARENGNFEVSMYLYYYPPEGALGVVNIPKELDMASHKIAEQASFEESEIAFVRNNDSLTNTTLADEVVGYTRLDYMIISTSHYDYTEFEQPPGEFNNQFSDFGEDIDDDELYNYLVINVGVDVNEAGDFRVRGYLYDEQSHQVDSDYNVTFLDTGNQTVQLKFEGIKIRQNRVNGTFDVSLGLYNYSTGDSLDYLYYTTSQYNYTDFQIPPAEFNDVYSDYGEDADGDGLYDYLVVNVGVDVREAGDYRLYSELYENGTYNYVDYDSTTKYLGEGDQIVQLRFEGIRIRNNEYNGTYDLKYLGLYNATSPVPPPTPPPTVTPTPSAGLYEDLSEGKASFSVGYGEQLDYRLYAYTTSYYDYTEFQIPPAKFNDVYSDYGDDTDSDGLYNYLVINVSIDVREAGNYRVSGQLHENETYDFVDYDSTTDYLEVGNQMIQLRFDAWAITKSGTFDLKYLGLYNATYPQPTPTPAPTAAPTATPAVRRESTIKAVEDIPVGYGEQLDYSYYAYTTGYYEPLPRPALLNDVYSDFGDDTDDPDELYNFLVINVGVNVSEIGNYQVNGYLYEAGTDNYVDSVFNTVYHDHPGNQTIPLKFKGIKIRNNEYNGTYDLRYLYLYDANYPVPIPTPTPPPAVPHESVSKATGSIPIGYGEQLDYRYYAYTTLPYDYTEFQLPIPDAYESDDNYSTANYISVDGTKQTHDFHVPGDHDWLKFNATKDGFYTVETTELGPESDTYLYLYDTEGISEIEHNDDGGSGLASKIFWECGASGTYYLMVRHWSSSAFGPETGYNISITVKEAPPNISWNMTISATNQLEPVVVGMHSNATDGYDPEFDAFSQTPVQGKVILILDDVYSTNIKKTRSYNESVSWNLQVGVPTGQTTTLSWNVPSDANFIILILEGDTVLPSGSQLDEGSHELTVIAELEEYIEFCMDLKAGWNMVSIPVIPDNNSVQAIFGNISTLETMPIMTWQSPSFVEVSEIEPKIGYWVFTPTATTICITGEPITNTTLNLKAGWNMVGTVGMDNLTISEIQNQVPQSPAVTWVAPSFVDTDIIELGKSVWVFVTADTIITVGEAFSSEMKSEVAPKTAIMGSLISAKTEEWNLTISATNQLEPVTFGLHPDATDNYDSEYDAFTQTPVQGRVILILDDIYATEINEERMTWNLSVGVPASETTTLRWNSSCVPWDLNLTLDGIDMKSQDSLQLGDGSHLFIISGKEVDTEHIFDTNASSNPYPSISGTHNGTITPFYDLNITKMYTYPCTGTGGHTEYVAFFNATTGKEVANGTWDGYQGSEDYHYIEFESPFVLRENETYNYTIRTGSYPQIIHSQEWNATGGVITCTSFEDANGNVHTDWIPAIKLY